MFEPLEPILSDPEVMEIMINGPDNIYVEKRGQLVRTDLRFNNEDALLDFVRQIATPMGLELNESHPILDLRLQDGSLVHVVGYPIALTGVSVTIRKYARTPMTPEKLIEYGSLNEDMLTFLQACVQARLNILIAGGTGSGKTTIMNVVAGMIPEDERIVTCERVADLRLPQPHIVVMEMRPANLEGKGEVSMKHLVESAIKMRPDRILVNEIQGPEIGALLMAINSGHDGSIMGMHAESVRDALVRLEVYMLENNPSMPVLAMREQMAAGIDIIVNQHRLRDGVRRMTYITEVIGIENGVMKLQDIFEFVQTGYENGKISGHFSATGNVPRCLSVIEGAGVTLPEGFFTPKA